MLLLSSADVHTRNNKSFLHCRSLSVAVYLTGHLAAALLEEKKSQLWIFPTVYDERWCRPSTRRLQMDRDHCQGGGGGLIFEGKCILFENKPPPQSRSCLLLKKVGLIFGRIWYTSSSQSKHELVLEILCLWHCEVYDN